MGEIIKTRLQKSECLCHFFSFLLNNMSGMTTLKKSFLSGDSNSNSQKCDYRQYIINLNSENNSDKFYDNLEIGLEAFKNLGKLIYKFPQYNLNDKLEKMYS